MSYDMIHYPQDERTVYVSVQAAHIACVSLDFLVACEREGLVSPQSTPGGEKGYTLGDIERLIVIRRLHEDLALDLGAIEVVLHLRERVREHAERRRNLERKLARQKARLQSLQRLVRRLQG